MDEQRLWGIPSWKTIGIAIVFIIIFMLVAHCLYASFYPASTAKSGYWSAYWLKVGDALINGAIVGLFVAVVKTIIELPKWAHEIFGAKNNVPNGSDNAVHPSGRAPTAAELAKK